MNTDWGGTLTEQNRFETEDLALLSPCLKVLFPPSLPSQKISHQLCSYKAATNNSKIKMAIPFIIPFQRIKYFWVILAKESERPVHPKPQNRDWRASSAVKSSCSCKRPRLNSQHPYGEMTPGPGNPMQSLTPWAHIHALYLSKCFAWFLHRLEEGVAYSCELPDRCW